jgi:putative transposase
MKERYSYSSHTVFNVNYHLVWCPKFRRKVLIDEVEIRLKEILYEQAKKYGCEIKEMKIMPDHVHLFVSCRPIHSPHNIVQKLKGLSSRILREEFPHLKKRIPTLWTRSYFCETVGHISEERIKKYIEQQKAH